MSLCSAAQVNPPRFRRLLFFGSAPTRKLGAGTAKTAPQADNFCISAYRSALPSKPMPGTSGIVMYPLSTFTPSGKPPYGWSRSGAQARSDVQRHLVTAVRNAATRRPVMLTQHVERAQVLDQPVAQRTVDLQPVAVKAKLTLTALGASERIWESEFPRGRCFARPARCNQGVASDRTRIKWRTRAVTVYRIHASRPDSTRMHVSPALTDPAH